VSEPAAHRPLRETHDDPPPILGTWKNIYRFVLVYLAALILLFWWFTRHYAPGP
jgi:hypothetical protein